MAYRALYRQWRPKNFSQMVGQKTIVDTLRNQVVTGRIAHAYLFCGSRGTGKTSTAKILARAINCEHPNNGDPCGECPNCLRAEREETLDIIEIDAASNNGVDEMRDLRDTVKYPPQYGQYKVYIIDEVHMLSTSAFNALLKTLEEPPAHVVFILATTEPQKLPATILSRCQRFDFGRISAPEIAARLREAVDGAEGTASDGALMAIARAAEGGMRDALSILDMCLGYGQEVDEALVRRVLGTSDRGFLFRFSEALREEDAGTVFQLVDELMRGGREPAVFAREFGSHIRALLTAKCCPEAVGKLLDVTEEDAKEYVRQAEEYTITRLMKLLDLFLALETEMRYASSPRLALENTCLKACLRTQETDAQALMDRIEELEKKLERLAEEGVRPAAATGGKKKAGAAASERAAVSTTPVMVAPPPSDAQGVWKATMELVKKREPSLLGLLGLGRFTGVNGAEYQWTRMDGSPFITQSLNTPARSEKIAGLLSEVTGTPCTFRAMDPMQQEAPAGDSTEQAIASFAQTFGRDAVTVID